MTRFAVLAVVVAACGTDTVVITPVIDEPDSSDNAAVGDLKQIVVAIAHAGDPNDIVSQTFNAGDSIDVTGVPFADDLVIHITGDKDVAYGRTCRFAVSPTGDPPSPHLFLSRLVKFATLPFTPDQRVGGASVTAPDGSALIVGGAGAGGDVIDVERYDPTSNTSSVIGQVLPREGAVVAGLGADTAQFAVLGGAQAGGLVQFFETIDVGGPATHRVETHQDNMMGRVRLTATTLTDGTIVVIGGEPPGMVATGIVDQITPAPGGTPEVMQLPRAVLAHSRVDHTATRLGNDNGAKVLIAGGTDDSGAVVAVAELFRPLTGDLADPASFAPMMKHPRSKHHAVLAPDGSVLIIGGVQPDGMGGVVGVTQIEQFSFDTGFVDVAQLDPSAGFVDFTTTTLPDGRILVIGGLNNPSNPASAVATTFIIEQHPVTGGITVSAADSLGVPRAGHQASLLCDGTVLVTGGTADSSPAERYNPIADGRR
jgi:hypothetical protein